MYNEELKDRYISKKESETIMSPNFLNNLFTKTEPFEEKVHKDVCEWTLNEIIEFYKFSDLYSLESLANINSNLLMYTNWCLTESLVSDGQNHFLELDSKMLLSCVNTDLLGKTVLTWDELSANVDLLMNYSDRYIFYALYEGMCGEEYREITFAKSEDVTGNTIRLCTGRKIDVSSKFIEVAMAAAEEERYYEFGKKNKAVPFRSGVEDDGYFFRRIKRSYLPSEDSNLVHTKSQILARRFGKSIKYLGLPIQITPKKIILSGKLNYIKGIMEKEGETDLKKVLMTHKEEIDCKYSAYKLRTIPVFIEKYSWFFE